MYSRVTATAVVLKMGREQKLGEERKGMHSWWISHFGLWPGSHPTTFKLAAACKILHISHRVLHPLWGPHAPTTTLINQLLEKKKKSGAPLSSYPSGSHSLWNGPNSSPHANCSSHHKHAELVTDSTHVTVHLQNPPTCTGIQYVWVKECSMSSAGELRVSAEIWM